MAVNGQGGRSVRRQTFRGPTVLRANRPVDEQTAASGPGVIGPRTNGPVDERFRGRTVGASWLVSWCFEPSQPPGDRPGRTVRDERSGGPGGEPARGPQSSTRNFLLSSSSFKEGQQWLECITPCTEGSTKGQRNLLLQRWCVVHR